MKPKDVSIVSLGSPGQGYVCVSVYILRRNEWGGVWLLVGSPTGMEVVVLGGHVIVELRLNE